MRAPQEMVKTAARLSPALAASLYGGRLLAEWTPMPGWAGVVCLLLLTGWLAYRKPLRQTWPAWGLAGYVFYTEPNPRAAGLAAVAALLLAVFNERPKAPAWLGRNWIWAGGVFAGALLLYSQTTARGILPADSGEFQLVAARLGVAHPPGFPLYTMLAHLAAQMPAGDGIAHRINWLSGLISAGTLALVYLSAVKLTGRKSSGLLACLALGTSTTFWAQAGVANVRSLTAFFAAAALYALIRLEHHLRANPSATRLPRPLLLLAFALSLGVTHHASLAFMGLAWTVSVLWWMPAWRSPGWLITPRRWLPLAAVVLAGLLPLAYLPLRAGAGAWGAPDDLTTWDGFWQHVLARGFAGDFFYFRQPEVLWQRLGVMGNVLTFQFSPWLLAGMALGLAWLGRQNGRLALALAGGFALHTLVTALYRAPQTVEYMMPATIPLALFGGCALRIMPNGAHPWRQAAAAALAAGLFLAGGVQARQHYGSFALDPSLDTVDYANYILKDAPPDSVVLANWHWATPLWYSQQVLGQRADLRIRYVPPGGEPYAQTWVRAIQAEMAAGREVIATWYDADAYGGLPPPEPLGEAFWFRQTPRASLPASFTPLDLRLGSAHFLGYELQPATVTGGEEIVLTVAWSPVGSQVAPLSLFAHGVQEWSGLIAQADETARAAAGITLTQLRLTLRPGSTPGEMSVLLGVAGAAEPPAAITAVTIAPSQETLYTAHPVYRTVPSGRPLLRLVGYDWDATVPGQTRLYLHWQTDQGYQTEVRENVNPAEPGLPEWFGPWGRWRPLRLKPPDGQHYVPFGQGIVWIGGGLSPDDGLSPGQMVRITPRFRSQAVGQRDVVVSVRLVGYEADGFHWAWWDLADGVPALGGIPTLKWIRGSLVRDPHWLQTAAEATPGQSVEGLLRLYDAFSQRPLPILDERIAAQGVWVSLGRGMVVP